MAIEFEPVSKRDRYLKIPGFASSLYSDLVRDQVQHSKRLRLARSGKDGRRLASAQRI